jgi:hypothetical protein
VLFQAACPILLNGIEEVISRPDLGDRAIFLTLTPIGDAQRRPAARADHQTGFRAMVPDWFLDHGLKPTRRVPAGRIHTPSNLKPHSAALTMLTVPSALVLTLMILVPGRPSRENVISMPSVRQERLCAAVDRRAPADFWPRPCAARCHRGYRAPGPYGASENFGRPQRRFASRSPEREICHTREPVEVNASQDAQATFHCVEQGAEDAGPRDLELAPKFGLRSPQDKVVPACKIEG